MEGTEGTIYFIGFLFSSKVPAVIFKILEVEFKGITILIASVLFTIEMYLNFSAYTDIALGVAKSIKLKGEVNKVWCFIGDMTFETGLFYETYKYAKNLSLPIKFVVEDNGLSTHTPTEDTWGGKRDIPDDVIYYKYKRTYPHHGTGNWVLF